MTRPPSDVTSHLTDDDLGHLLRSTFAAAEPLASRSPFPPSRPRSRRTPALVAATAVLALAVGGAYVGTRGGDPEPPPATSPAARSAPTAEPTSEPSESLAPRTNRARARMLAAETLARLADHVRGLPGIAEASADDLPVLRDHRASAAQANESVRESAYWIVTGDPAAVQRWFEAHPLDGFTGTGGWGSSPGEDGVLVTDTSFAETDRSPRPAEADIVVMLQDLGDGRVGVRTVSEAIWRPVRDAATYVSAAEVTSVEVVASYSGVQHRRELTDPEDVRALLTAWNELPGWPEFIHSCPARLKIPTFDVVIRTPTRTVTGTSTGYCEPVWKVRVDGVRQRTNLEVGPDFEPLVLMFARGEVG